jgi:ABC-2 type transport system permease protein
MSLARVYHLLARDVGRGPRSAVFLYALVMPVLIALVTKVILMAVFDPSPRLGVVDLGQSEITARARAMDGIDLTRASSADALRELVEANDVDAGLVLGDGFDDAVRAGERPELGLYLSGESRATHRIVLAVTAIDLVRSVEGRPAPVEVVTEVVGDGPGLPIEDLVVFGVLLWPLLVCSTLVPGLMLVQEREQRTLEAMLVTPTTMTEVLMGKAALGFVMALVMCVVTLSVFAAWPVAPASFVVVLAVGIVLCNQIGLLYGTTARDGKALYNMAQTGNMVILAPLLFYFFPSWPQWIAKLFPTWWIIDPLYRVGFRGASLVDVAGDVTISLAIVLALVPLVARLGRRMKARLAGA